MDPPEPAKAVSFIPRNLQWRLIAFGFLLTFSSIFGQSHFIALFKPVIQNDLDLNNTAIGTIFFLATFGSALTLNYLGRLIDNCDVRLYTACVVIGLGGSCILLAHAFNPWTFLLALFLMRLCGQGLSGHTAITVTARLATVHRGKSISLVMMGFATGEAIAPLLIGVLYALANWRQLWIGFGIVEMIAVLGIAQLLLTGLDNRPPLVNKERGDLPDFDLSWMRIEVLQDTRFWKVAPTLFTPPLIVTSLLFFQGSLAATKDFKFFEWAIGFTAFPICAAICSFIGGSIADSRGSQYSLRLCPPFFLIGLLVPMLPSFALMPFVYYGILGIGVGLWAPAFSSMWREVYGPGHLGANLAMANAMAISASAISPMIFGILLDLRLGWELILSLCLSYVGFAYGSLMSTNLNTAAPPKRRVTSTAARIR